MIALLASGCATVPTDTANVNSTESRTSAEEGPFPPPLAPPPDAEIALFAMRPGTVVDDAGGAGEASILIDALGHVFIAAPKGSASTRGDALWRSDDGATFTSLGLPTFPFGGGDTDLGMDDDGTLYMPGQWGLRAPVEAAAYPGSPYPFCESVATSEDLGTSWTINPVACVFPGAVDRPWIATIGDSTAYMVFNQAGFGTTVVKSEDSGLTWTPAKLPAEPMDGSRRGNLVISQADGALYSAHTLADGPGVWVSLDGEEWELKLAHETANTVENSFPVVAVDDDGGVYLAWSEFLGVEKGFDIKLAHSVDHGATWSRPVKVNEGAKMAVMPWVVAGAAGRVALVWYETSELSVAEGASDEAEWFAKIAVSYNALDAAPTFTVKELGSEPVKHGPICLDGGGCDPRARRLLDFVEVGLAPDGTVHTVITKVVADDEPVLNVYFAQASGPRLR